MQTQRLVSRFALTLAGALLAAGCAGSGVMPISGGGVIDTLDQAPAVAQPQMDASLGAQMQSHTHAVAHMQTRSTAEPVVDTFYDMYHHGLCDNMD